jgi:phosphoribosylformimino-5-aminoimidazole carboxamide ribotide isomerase
LKILPVLDLMGGSVVRGVAGRRSEYRPIVSRLVQSSAPIAVAQAYRESFGLDELYLADLDAIGGAAPAWKIFENLQAAGFRLWVDAGIRDAGRAFQLADAGIATVVVGLETVAGPTVVAAVQDRLADRVVLSLDLRDGRPLANANSWRSRDPQGIVAEAVALGVQRVLVLDLAHVGVGQGVGTGDLCATLKRRHPAVELAAGGGVRGLDDLRSLRDQGVAAALVASALHDGALNRVDLAGL